jgi:DNA polymerase-3 subunit alpha
MQETTLQSQEVVATPQFVHLRCHSEYSIVDGIVRIDDYIAAANKDDMPAVALTDLSNLFGAIKFYKAARDKGVKPGLRALVRK